jgi:hypothetical protein
MNLISGTRYSIASRFEISVVHQFEVLNSTGAQARILQLQTLPVNRLMTIVIPCPVPDPYVRKNLAHNES